MKTFSTNNHSVLFEIADAVMLGQAPDGGLFMPENIPQLSLGQLNSFRNSSFNEIALQISKQFFCPEIPENDLKKLIDQAYDFDAPLKTVASDLHFLELFHGPTLAFKDFGARFMAQLMSYYLSQNNHKLNILVATSGDTGSAVAAAFHKVPNINVVILFPSGRVSKIQEMQLTTWGENIQALEIDGTFDDCQQFVKSAFQDREFKSNFQLTSANSINISRLIPQSFYYFYAWSRLSEKKSCFIVPSGNLGNVSAGVIAQRMGLPVDQFIIATNSNRVVPDYFESGNFEPKPSVATISNAMDVGNPSNLIRLQNIFKGEFTKLKELVSTCSFNDQETSEAINEVYQKYNYLICPHTAVGYLAAKEVPSDYQKIVLATAHPNKFADVLENVLGFELPTNELLAQVALKPTSATKLPANYLTIKNYIQLSLTER